MADYSLGTAHGQIKIDADTTGVEQAERAMGGLTSSAQSTEQAVGKTANGMGIAGAAIAGGLGLAVKTAADFDFQLSAIQSVSGATAGEMDKVREAALKIGTDTKFSATEAASAIEELAKAGIPLEDILGGAADATVALAAATGTDLAESATYASDVMNMFGLKASDMGGVVDTLAQTANASSIGMGDLGMAFSQVGAVANLVGMSVEDTASAIGQLGDEGIKGSDAGTSLKTMLMNLQPTTKAQTTAMKDLGLITKDGTNQFFNANGELKSLREVQGLLQSSTANLTDAEKQMALETIFGTDAIRAAAVMAENGAAGFDTFAKKQADTGTAAEQAKIRQDNLKSAMEQLMGSVETAAISIGSALTPMLRGLAEGLGVVVGWFNQLTPTQQAWVVGILAGAAGLLLLVAGILKTVMFVKNLITTMQTLRILSTATQSSFIKTAVVAVASWIKIAAQAAISAAATAASWAVTAVKSAASFVAMAASATLNAAKVAAAWVMTSGMAAARAIIQTAIAVAATVGGWILMGITAMINAVMIAAAWFIALGPIGWAIAALIALVVFVVLFWDEIVAFFKAGAEKVAEWLQKAWNWVVEKWNGIIAAFEAAKNWIGEKLTALWNKIVSIWNTIIAWFQGIPGKIGAVFSGAAAWLVEKGKGILTGLKNGVVNGYTAVSTWFSQLPGKIKSFLAAAGSWLLDAGRWLVEGLWNGISGAAGWLWDKVSGFAGDIVDNVLGFFGVSSPSKVFAEIGMWLTRGLGAGIEDNAADAVDEATRMAEAVVGALQDGLESGAGLQATIGATLADVVDSGVMGTVGMSAGGSDAFWDGTPLGAGYVPPSNEVASYAASQGDSGTLAGKTINFNTYNPVAERASDSEARRLRALSALGAF